MSPCVAGHTFSATFIILSPNVALVADVAPSRTSSFSGVPVVPGAMALSTTSPTFSLEVLLSFNWLGSFWTFPGGHSSYTVGYSCASSLTLFFLCDKVNQVSNVLFGCGSPRISASISGSDIPRTRWSFITSLL